MNATNSVTSFETVQRIAADQGWRLMGEPYSSESGLADCFMKKHNGYLDGYEIRVFYDLDRNFDLGVLTTRDPRGKRTGVKFEAHQIEVAFTNPWSA